MPLPKPNKGESEDDFMQRCMSNSTMEEEYPDEKQRYAVCKNQYEGGKEKVKEINLTGEVGWEITDRLVSSLLNKYSPEDVIININSYGGEVFEAFAIYNSIKNYAGTATTVIKGVAASAAATIFLAGKKRAVYKNSTFMAHEPWMFTAGEGDLLISRGNMLNDIRDIIARDLAKYIGKSKEEILEDLKNEIWLVGWESIAETGIADELLDSDEESEPEPVEDIAEKVKAIFEKLKIREKERAAENNLEKIAASITTLKNKSNRKTSPREEGEENKAEEKSMTKEEMKTKFPDLYNEIVEEGKRAVDISAAVQKDRENIRELLTIAGVSDEIAEKCTSGVDSGEFAKNELKRERQARQQAANEGNALSNLGRGAQTPADTAVPEESKIDKQAKSWDDVYDNAQGKKKEDK